MNRKPNPAPASKEAKERGCKCSIIKRHLIENSDKKDNYVPSIWIHQNCPLHYRLYSGKLKPLKNI